MFLLFRRRSGRARWILLAVNLGLLALIFGAGFLFHLRGSTLGELRIARIVIIVAVLAGASALGRRRRGDTVARDSAPPRPADDRLEGDGD